MNNVFEIKVENIDLIETPNRPLNDEYIENLISVGQFDKWPPIDVVEDTEEPGSYWILNGHHRLTAAERAGRETIKARVLKDSFNNNQIVLERFEDNLKNGLPPTTAERKEHADWLKRLFPQMTLAEISKRTGLSQAALSYHFNGVNRSANGRSAEQEFRAFAKMVEKVTDAGKGWFGKKHHKKHFLTELEKNPDLAESFLVVGKALIEAAEEFEESYVEA